MKKAFSLILAIVMVFALATTAFAAPINLVGTHGEHDGSDSAASVGDGVGPTFSDVTTSDETNTKINITAVSGDVTHKYAVDIEYVEMAVQVNGDNLVWDVNKLEYVVDTTYTGNSADKDQSFDVKIINYSDMPVYLTTAVSDGDANDHVKVMTILNDDQDYTELLAKTRIKSAVENNNAAFTYTFDVLVTTEENKTWVDVSNYYSPKFATNSDPKLIATVDLTISMNPS